MAGIDGPQLAAFGAHSGSEITGHRKRHTHDPSHELASIPPSRYALFFSIP
ncbi:MAG: hypothetical protein AAF488_06905 [Planctomycetota bacterium]